MTRGGIRDSYHGAISVDANPEDYQQLKVHASSAAATFTIMMLIAAVVGLLDDMLPEGLLRTGEISEPEGHLPRTSGWLPLLASTATGGPKVTGPGDLTQEDRRILVSTDRRHLPQPDHDVRPGVTPDPGRYQ